MVYETGAFFRVDQKRKNPLLFRGRGKNEKNYLLNMSAYASVPIMNKPNITNNGMYTGTGFSRKKYFSILLIR